MNLFSEKCYTDFDILLGILTTIILLSLIAGIAYLYALYQQGWRLFLTRTEKAAQLPLSETSAADSPCPPSKINYIWIVLALAVIIFLALDYLKII